MWPEAQTAFAAAVRTSDRIKPNAVVGDADRFAVYRNNVGVSLRDALAQTFPVVNALVGDEFFDAMAQVYVRSHLPKTPVLLYYGGDFADFIDGFSPAADVPYLADVARLERLWLDAYHARDVAPVDISIFERVPEADLDRVVFEAHPSLGVLCSDWPVYSIWQAHQGSAAADLSAVEFVPEAVCVVRPHLEVQVSRLPAETALFTEAVLAGSPLGAALDALPEHADATAVLSQFFLSGAVAGLSTVDC